MQATAIKVQTSIVSPGIPRSTRQRPHGSVFVPVRAAAILTKVSSPAVDTAYSNWVSSYLKADPTSNGSRKYVLKTPADQDIKTVSEGIGYGMLISLFKDNRSDFDALLAFYMKWKSPTTGLMSWRVRQGSNNGDFYTKADQGDNNSATDGDLDAAYALLLAGDQWGSSDYTAKGTELCKALYTHCISSATSLPLLGSWAWGSDDNVFSRSSDWMLGHFQRFTQVDDQWKKVYDAAVKAYKDNLTHHSTGLTADFYKAQWGANGMELLPDTVEDKYHEAGDKQRDGFYNYNACRVPWRLAAYYKMVVEPHGDPDGMLPVLNALKAFFEGQSTVWAGYKLDGTPIDDNNKYEDNSFTAPAWALLTVMKSEKADYLGKRVLALQNGQYYGDSIYLCAALELGLTPSEATAVS